MPLKLHKEKKIQNVIGIAAGKGGVGKSSLTVNLALALKSLGYQVGILDADLYGPSVRTMLPETVLPVQSGDKITPALCSGISVMSMAYFQPKGQASVIRAPIANGWVTQFLQKVEWGDLDYLLIDFPPGTGDIQITLSQQARLTCALIITTPQEIALQDVRKCIKMFDQVKIPVLGVVENMSYYQIPASGEKVYLFGKGGGEKLAEWGRLPLLGQIPIDPMIGECLDSGTSLFTSSSDALKACFLNIAEEMVHEIEGLKDTSGIKTIQNKDAHTFTIEWSDGTSSDFAYRKLQEKCPCAGCKNGPQKLDEKVSALEIKMMGRYAIKIAFTSGCSSGIYEYDLLKGLK